MCTTPIRKTMLVCGLFHLGVLLLVLLQAFRWNDAVTERRFVDFLNSTVVHYRFQTSLIDLEVAPANSQILTFIAGAILLCVYTFAKQTTLVPVLLTEIAIIGLVRDLSEACDLNHSFPGSTTSSSFLT